MTRSQLFYQRHYEFFAKFLGFEQAIAKELGDADRLRTIESMTRLLAGRFGEDSPKFDRAKFDRAVEKSKEAV